MSDSIFGVRDWGLSRPWLRPSARQIRSARSLSVEQALQVAPEWGRVEARRVRKERPRIVTGL